MRIIKITVLIIILFFSVAAYSFDKIYFQNRTAYFAMVNSGGSIDPEIYPDNYRTYTFEDVAHVCVGQDPCKLFVTVYGGGQPVLMVGLILIKLDYQKRELKITGWSDQKQSHFKFSMPIENSFTIFYIK
jgi:hypothetical protein